MLIKITTDKDNTNQKFRPDEIIQAAKEGIRKAIEDGLINSYGINTEFEVREVTKENMQDTIIKSDLYFEYYIMTNRNTRQKKDDILNLAKAIVGKE